MAELPVTETSIPRKSFEIIIVGAGMAGIGSAIRLKDEGIDDYVVLEKAAALGGCWRANTYPGCACDVPSRSYSYSFAPNPNWTRTFADQPEILEYLGQVAKAHEVDTRIRFGIELLTANWNEANLRWELETTDGLYQARILVCATGPLHVANIPSLPGLKEFTGKMFHSSQWDHAYSLDGKRVAVVGTGASAIQFVPKIQPKLGHLHLFQRTPSWVLPKPNPTISEKGRALFARRPRLQRFYRSLENAWFELIGLGFRHPWILKRLEKRALGYLAREVKDEQLRAKLTPSFALGCKRMLLSTSYLRALTQPNVSVHATAVERIVPSGVVGADGKVAEVDAIIFGTGFHVADMPIAQHLRDGKGRLLADLWKSGASAYLGTAIAGYPNLFLLFGPNLGTGHSSAFTIVEAQLNYMIDGLKKMRARGVSQIQVRADVQQAFNRRLQKAVRTTVYNAGGCASYYLDANGKNTFAWPWSMRRLERETRRFDMNHYQVSTVPAEVA